MTWEENHKDPMRITLFNVFTRQLLNRRFQVGNIMQADEQADAFNKGQDKESISWVLGWYDNSDTLWVNWDGVVVVRDANAPPIPVQDISTEGKTTVEMVKLEASRRITELIKPWMIEREFTGGKPISPDLRDAAQAIREASNRIEAMDPIPLDFHLDKYWI